MYVKLKDMKKNYDKLFKENDESNDKIIDETDTNLKVECYIN